jgi:hypothetical protein
MPTLEAIDLASTPAGEPYLVAPGSKASRASSIEISIDDFLEEVATTNAGPMLLEEENLEEPGFEILSEDCLKSYVEFYPPPRIAVATDSHIGLEELRPSALSVEAASDPEKDASLKLADPTGGPSLQNHQTIHVVPSFLPVAMDLSPARADLTTSLMGVKGALGRGRLALAVTSAAIAALCVVVLGLRSSAATHRPAPPDPATTPTPRVAAAAPSASQARGVGAPAEIAGGKTPARTGAPGIDVGNLPQAPVGTITRSTSASGHRLFVDGIVSPRGEAVVSCGKHRVKVGSRGRTQVVEVPCGGSVVAEP